MAERKLISIKPIETRLPEDVYNQLEDVIWEQVNKQPNPEELLQPYEFPFENIQKIADSDNEEYKENIRNMADDIWSKNDWIDSLIVYYIFLNLLKLKFFYL